MKACHGWRGWCALVASVFTWMGPAAAQALEPRTGWQPPNETAVVWRGMLNTEGGAVGSGTQFGPYPVPGAAGLLVAILTHATLSAASQSEEARRAQEEADKVLAPVAADLKAWPASALWQQAAAGQTAAQLWDGQAEMGPAARMETPQLSYTLAQDGRALMLDTALKWTPGSGGLPREWVLRVVSAPVLAADAHAHWRNDSAQALKATAATLLAQVLQIGPRIAGLPEASAESPPAWRTLRYLQGQTERSERAELLWKDCERAVLRNLRGWILSVPLRRADIAPDCAPR